MTDKETPEPLGAPEGPAAPEAPGAPEPPATPAPLEGEAQHGWEDKNNDGILQGDEIDMSDPFDAIDGED